MKQAVRRKFHYIYKITRTDGSGKYYIGMHSTDDLDDDYFGSGTILSRSIKKHGKEKHIKEILEHLPTREALKLREKELVNEELLGDKKCMNLKPGGEGGFSSAASIAGNKSKKRSPEQYLKAVATRRKNGFVSCFAKPRWFETRGFSGKKHSEETLKKMSQVDRSGSKNSQFGTCWITNGSESKKIKVDRLDEFIKLGYRRGRQP